MSEAVFCEEYVVLLEAIRDALIDRDALVDIEDEPMSTVRAMAEQAIEGDPPKGRGPRHAEIWPIRPKPFTVSRRWRSRRTRSS